MDEVQKIQEFVIQFSSALDHIESGQMKSRHLIQALLHRIESISQSQEIWEAPRLSAEQRRLLRSVKRTFQKMKDEYKIPSAARLTID